MDTVDVPLIQSLIARHDAMRPRSRQQSLGPSEIGGKCVRKLGYKIAGTEPTRTRGLALPAWIGTAAHTQMSEACALDPAWDTDLTVSLPGTGHLTTTGLPITGTADAYHRPSATIVDWKFLGDTAIGTAKKLGEVSDQYREQVHLYALGATAAGIRVDRVAVAMIPRSGNKHQMHVWSEPYIPRIALDAIKRLDNIATLARGGLLSSLPTADDWCVKSCPFYLPSSTELDRACPGHHDAD